jgi:hypothetical protein
MITHSPTTPFVPATTRLVTPVAWTAAGIGSALPLILWQEVTGTPAPFALLVAQVGVLLALLLAAQRYQGLRPIEPQLRWLLALAAGWHLLFGLLEAQPAWEPWQHSVPWVVRGAVVQALIFVPSLLLVLLGVGRNSRRALRLTWADESAAARPDLLTLWRRPAWSRLGGFWMVGISLGTLIAMTIAIPPNATTLARLLPVFPIVLMLAALNTFNEEFGFRNVPLATLPAVLGERQALFMTAAFFGLEHFYGNPPALSGVLLATFLGYLLGKSMLETGGSRWAWLIHWLQDIIIFSFLVMGWSR